MELVFGEGGTDSKLFVSDLASAYLKYASSLSLKAETLTSEDGHSILKFTGKGVWNAFKNEPGKHCVQRCPENGGGRRHTSIVTVGVLPLPPERDTKPLREQDLETITQTGKQKAGGQNANKVASAVRMKHKPTGLSVFINGRDQGQNKKEALRILTARVNERHNNQIEAQYSAQRKKVLGNCGRGGKVRTYNFIRSEITDHNLNRSTTDVKSFMRGDFSAIM